MVPRSRDGKIHFASPVRHRPRTARGTRPADGHPWVDRADRRRWLLCQVKCCGTDRRALGWGIRASVIVTTPSATNSRPCVWLRRCRSLSVGRAERALS